MKKTLLLLPCLAVGTTALLLAPAKNSLGFSKLGTSLNVSSERDWKLFDTFADTNSNNNTTPVLAFPGWQGAAQALWKAAAEWGSGVHGDGSGDPTQTIGDGQGNFDFFFGGAATGTSNSNGNVGVIANCGGSGVFAYVASGGNSWWMRFCDEWTWSDGPGGPGGSNIDLQGVGCHEFGHSLGLGHSSVNGATMVGSTFNGFDQRAIAADDTAGVQCIYNVKDPLKCEITDLAVNVPGPGGSITITGLNFSTTGNEVWFQPAGPTSAGSDPRVIVSNVNSPSTTSITVAIPSGVYDGDVHVKNTETGGKSLSNGWPADLDGVGGPSIEITGFDPSTIDPLIPGTDQTVTMNGSGFSSNTTLTIDGVPLDAANYTYVNSTTITIDMPQVSALGAVSVQVDDGVLTDSSSINVAASTAPILQIGNGDGPFNNNQILSADGIDIIFAGPPGELHFVLWSTSNVGGSIPIVTLCISNNFLDLFELTRGNIGTAGYTSLNLPISSTFLILYSQSLTLSQGTPIPVSNCQEAFILP